MLKLAVALKWYTCVHSNSSHVTASLLETSLLSLISFLRLLFAGPSLAPERPRHNSPLSCEARMWYFHVVLEMAFPCLQCQLPLSPPPTVPSMYRHNVPVLVSTAHLQINWIFYFLFCTAPQCPLSPLPLWPFPSRFPISCVPCSTITQLLTDGVQAAEWDVIDISVLLASLRLLFRYWRVCLPAVCLLHLDGAAY